MYLMDSNKVQCCDLHTHTTASDGILSPEAILTHAQVHGLQYLAITDHDTTDGVLDALMHLDMFDGVFIPAVEINVEGLNDRKMEILGYNIDPKDLLLQRLFKRMEKSRLIRGKLMVTALQNLNLDITWEDVLKIKDYGVIGRPHVARALIARGHCASVQEAFTKYLGRGKPAFVSRYKLHPREIISLIHQAGGVAILAHPLISSYNGKELHTILKELFTYGLDGFELHYDYSRFFQSEQIEHLIAQKAVKVLNEFAKNPDYIVTGGSDWHGTGSCPFGSLKLPCKTLEQIISLQK